MYFNILTTIQNNLLFCLYIPFTAKKFKRTSRTDIAPIKESVVRQRNFDTYQKTSTFNKLKSTLRKSKPTFCKLKSTFIFLKSNLIFDN